jgi:ribosomal protein S18 acetylase RimI-like enzyme
VLIRRARPEEYDAVGEVTVAAYEEFLLGPEDEYRHRLRDAAGRDRGAELWVAASDDDTRLLGTVTLCPAGSAWREIAGEDEGEFRMLAVSPEARGQGVGESLVRLVVDRFAADGARAVVLSSLADMTAAHRIYDRLGFTRLPERDWRPLPHVELIAFGKELR